jgi:hypothetical protein
VLIHIVTEVDERPESMSSGPVSAHIDLTIADHEAGKLNEPLRGKLSEVGHYFSVFPIELDLSAKGMELQALRDEIIRQQARMARGRRS